MINSTMLASEITGKTGTELASILAQKIFFVPIAILFFIPLVITFIIAIQTGSIKKANFWTVILLPELTRIIIIILILTGILTNWTSLI